MGVSWLDDVLAETMGKDECLVEDFYKIEMYDMGNWSMTCTFLQQSWHCARVSLFFLWPEIELKWHMAHC